MKPSDLTWLPLENDTPHTISLVLSALIDCCGLWVDKTVFLDYWFYPVKMYAKCWEHTWAVSSLMIYIVDLMAISRKQSVYCDWHIQMLMTYVMLPQLIIWRDCHNKSWQGSVPFSPALSNTPKRKFVMSTAARWVCVVKATPDVLYLEGSPHLDCKRALCSLRCGPS